VVTVGGGAPPRRFMDFSSVMRHSASMAAVLFDTLRLSRTLRDKGRFTSEQAETLAEALGSATQEDLATKTDVVALRSEIAAVKADVTIVKAGIANLATKSELAEVKADIAGVKAQIANLATKSELAEVKADIAAIKAEIANLATKSELAEVKAELAGVKADIAGVKADILKWVVGAIGFQTVAMLGTVVGLVKIFAK
jgi:chromosome segregation ATPase